MRLFHHLAASVAALSLLAATPVSAAPANVAPLSALVAKVDIPFDSFTLPNGLRVLVHTDRKAPIVGVTVYYRVGSRHEPRGKTGFAHLYEHLFFGGSENVPNFDVLLEGAGSTPTNGSTWYDRTNYVETVPTGALDLALFMESDRMGHLLGAVSQDKLDKQRGVVQNEKRQGDNQPLGLLRYAIGDGLFPVGHPYRHATIGSMADLDAATLDDVKRWFVDHYGPNNVVLALAGDIDAATARPMVERWFGAIPAGKPVEPTVSPIPALPAPVRREMTDRVPSPVLVRAWAGPGLNDADRWPMEVGLGILGGLASSRLDNALVRQAQLAVSVTAGAESYEQAAIYEATMTVKPGVARKDAEAAFDKVIADFLRDGPTEDEVRRMATRLIAAQIDALEGVGGFGGKGATLAEGLLYTGDAASYRKDLARIAALTPAEIKAAMQRWLRRPGLLLAVTPGERTEDGAKLGGWADGAPDPAPVATAPLPPVVVAKAAPRTAPPVLPVQDLVLPPVEHARLSNGIKVDFVRRPAVPRVLVSLDFDAGFAADPTTAPGTQSLMLSLLDEGTTTRNSTQIAEEQEQLGADIATTGTLDATTVRLSALTANLAPSLDLLADVVRRPAFAPSEVARLRAQRLAEIQQALANPSGIVRQVLGPLVYGPAHPYGVPSSGLGEAKVVAKLDAAALRAAHARSIRPDLATITVVGDSDLPTLLPLLEARFGTWQASGPAPVVKNLDAPIPPARQRLVVIDRPGSPQSVIAAARVLPVRGTQDGLTLDLANDVLGGGFLSRLNLDLREDKGWSYGVSSSVSRVTGPRLMSVAAPVQADRTGDSVKAVLADMAAFPATKGVTAEETARVTEGAIRALPSELESNTALLGAIITNRRLGRPDDYFATLASRLRKADAAAIDGAAQQYLRPEGLTIVVVGDRKVVDPQLAGLGLPIEYMVVDNSVSSD